MKLSLRVHDVLHQRSVLCLVLQMDIQAFDA